MKSLLFATALFAMMLGSCKKSDSIDPNSDQAKTDLLVDKKWQVISEYLRDSTGHTSQDMWPGEASWIKDDYSIWRSNLTFFFSENIALAPGHTVPVNDSGTWLLKNAVINMISSKPGTTEAPFTVTAISASNLTIEFPKGNATGIYKLIQVP